MLESARSRIQVQVLKFYEKNTVTVCHLLVIHSVERINVANKTVGSKFSFFDSWFLHHAKQLLLIFKENIEQNDQKGAISINSWSLFFPLQSMYHRDVPIWKKKNSKLEGTIGRYLIVRFLVAGWLLVRILTKILERICLMNAQNKIFNSFRFWTNFFEVEGSRESIWHFTSLISKKVAIFTIRLVLESKIIITCTSFDDWGN